MNRTYSSRDDVDLALYVPSVEPNHYYFCPTLAAAKKHINDLREVLAPGSNWNTHRHEIAHEDIDRLLARWLYLQIVGLPDSEVA